MKRKKLDKWSMIFGVIAVALLCIVAFMFVKPKNNNKIKNKAVYGCESPEAVIEETGKRFAAGDVSGIVDLGYERGQEEAYTEEKYREIVKDMPSWEFLYRWIPQEGILKRLYIAEKDAGLAAQVRFMAVCLKEDSENLYKGKSFATEEASVPWLEELKLDRLDTFKILRYDEVPAYTGNEEWDQQWGKQVFGTDEMKSYMIFYEYAGRTYGNRVLLGRYEGKWYLIYLQFEAGNPVFKAMTEQEYENELEEIRNPDE